MVRTRAFGLKVEAAAEVAVEIEEAVVEMAPESVAWTASET